MITVFCLELWIKRNMSKERKRELKVLKNPLSDTAILKHYKILWKLKQLEAILISIWELLTLSLILELKKLVNS